MNPVIVYPEQYKPIIDFLSGALGGIALWCWKWYKYNNKSMFKKDWSNCSKKGIDFGLSVYIFLGGFSGLISLMFPEWFIAGSGVSLYAGFRFPRIIEKLTHEKILIED